MAHTLCTNEGIRIGTRQQSDSPLQSRLTMSVLSMPARKCGGLLHCSAKVMNADCKVYTVPDSESKSA